MIEALEAGSWDPKAIIVQEPSNSEPIEDVIG